MNCPCARPVLSTATSSYNDLGQITSSLDAAHQPTQYQYDADGRQISVTDALTETTSIAYDLAGRQVSTTDALGHITQQVPDGDGRVIKTVFADGSFTQTGYDSQGRQSSVTDQMGRTTQYQHDPSGRLSAVVLPAVNDPQNNNLSVQPTTQYFYDVYGDMTSMQNAATTMQGASSRITQFTFDQFRHQLTHTLPMSQVESQLLEEHTNGSTAASMSYLLALGVFGQTNGSGVTNYLMPDGQRSTRLLTDSSGTIQSRYGYDAYGNLVSGQAGVVNPPATRILYAGEQFDPALQLYYLRARYYNSTAGRLTRLDDLPGRIASPPTLHKYIYALDNPTNLSDPSGNGPLVPPIVAPILVGGALVGSNLAYGRTVEREIAADFIANGWPGTRFFSTAMSTILGRIWIPMGLGLGRPDLADTAAGLGFLPQIYEIKTAYSFWIGLNNVAYYLSILNFWDPIKLRRLWVPGESYFPPPAVPINATAFAIVNPPVAGVITYQVVAMEPIAIAVATYYAVAIYQALSVATVNAQLGAA